MKTEKEDKILALFEKYRGYSSQDFNSAEWQECEAFKQGYLTKENEGEDDLRRAFRAGEAYAIDCERWGSQVEQPDEDKYINSLKKAFKDFKYSNTQFDNYKYRVRLLVQDLKGNDLINSDFYTDCEDKVEISLKLLSAAEKKYKKGYKAEIIHWATKEQDEHTSKFLDDI